MALQVVVARAKAGYRATGFPDHDSALPPWAGSFCGAAGGQGGAGDPGLASSEGTLMQRSVPKSVRSLPLGAATLGALTTTGLLTVTAERMSRVAPAGVRSRLLTSIGNPMDLSALAERPT